MERKYRGANYACVAAATTVFGGRCRRNASSRDLFCHVSHQPSDPVAEPAKRIFLNFALNEKEVEQAKKAGIPFRDRSLDEVRKAHLLAATRTSRSPKVYREDVPDGGVNVFGKNPIVARGFDWLQEEFASAGFSLTHVVVEPTNKGHRLLTAFHHSSILDLYGPPMELEGSVKDFVMERVHAAWHVHIYDNPLCHHVPGTTAEGGQTDMQFYLMRELSDGGAIVQMIWPPAEDQRELDPETFRRATRFSTSTVNCHGRLEPWQLKRERPFFILYNEGHWDAD